MTDAKEITHSPRDEVLRGEYNSFIEDLTPEEYYRITIEAEKFENDPEAYTRELIYSEGVEGVKNRLSSLITVLRMKEEQKALLEEKLKTLEKEREEEARRLPRDVQTGSISKDGFLKILLPLLEELHKSDQEQEVNRRDTKGKQIHFIVFDVDNFSIVNEMLTHPVADDLMTAFHEELDAEFRNSDVILRPGMLGLKEDENIGTIKTGGDEGAIIVECRPVDVPLIKEKVRDAAIRALKKDARFEKAISVMDVSVGCASSSDHSSPREAFQAADVDMYSDKANKQKRIENRNSQI